MVRWCLADVARSQTKSCLPQSLPAMSILLVHYERLRRHFEHAVRTYDHVSFLDLANSARIWTEIKHSIHEDFPAFASASCFKSSSPNKRILRLCKGRRNVFAGMPEGVTTFANNGHLVTSPDCGPNDGDFTVSAEIKFELTNLGVWDYSFAGVGLKPNEMRYLSMGNVKRCTFINWLGSEAARVSYFADDGKLCQHALTLEAIIKRVSNVYDGSHYSKAATEDSDNRFDEPIRHLFKHLIGGLPVPYFILLRFAQEIVTQFAPHCAEVKRGHRGKKGRGKKGSCRDN